MKVLWVCNIVLPQFSKKFGLTESYGGGWMSSLYNDLLLRDELTLAVCSPVDKQTYKKLDATKYISSKETCYLFPENLKNPHKPLKKTKEYLEKIIKEYEPDIVHIHGTEYYHTFEVTNILKQNNYVISLQGLTKYIAENYLLGIPCNELRKRTFRDIVRNDSILLQQKKFSYRGKFEELAIQKAKYVIGRTIWDKNCVKLINPKIKYFVCNENLRNGFYNYRWDKTNCEEFSIFISQCNSPIKGFHIFLKALNIIKKNLPNVKVYTTGQNPMTMNKFKISNYQKYISSLILKYDLVNNIHFLGSLSEKEMINTMLTCNVFVCPSVIENSSNSIGEAMLLGMPIIASDVGGTKDLITDKKEGLLYSPNEYYILASLILDVFNNKYDDFMISNAKKKAFDLYNSNNNIESLLKIYTEIYEEKLRANGKNKCNCSNL